MALLPDQDRSDVHAQCMREEDGTFSLTKTDLRAAVDAIDAWLNANANAASLNSAIPQPARGQLTMRQKARLLVAVVLRRFVKGA